MLFRSLLSSLLSIILIIVAVVHKLRARRLTITKPPQALAVAIVVYLTVVLISSLQSSYPSIGLAQFIREVFFFVIIYILYDSIRESMHWFQAARALDWVGIVIVISIFIDFIVNYSSINRFSGVFISPTRAGLILTTVFPVSLARIQIGRASCWERV